MPKAASTVAHTQANAPISFALPDDANDADRELVRRILARCVETDPPNDPLAKPVKGKCWTWTNDGYNGYGQLGFYGRSVRVHRAMLAIYHRPSGNFFTDHLCRNRACCNPEHLEAVTPKENVRRGSATVHRGSSCAHCGSSDGHIRERGHSTTWVCHPCRLRREALYREKNRAQINTRQRAKRAAFRDKAAAASMVEIAPEDAAAWSRSRGVLIPSQADYDTATQVEAAIAAHGKVRT